MDDKSHHENRVLAGPAALVAAVSDFNFGDAVVEYVSSTAVVSNLSVFYFPDLTRPKPVQSLWSGRIDEYWLRHNGVVIASDPKLYGPVLEDVRSAPTTGVQIERWHPSDRDPIKRMFEKFGILERITTASRGKQFGYMSFFLRDKVDGWITEEEYERLREILPFVHELIGLRHRLAGSEVYQFRAGPNVSSLRELKSAIFSQLSKREAEVCDCVVNGLTVTGTALELGISESTVKTLRQRSYRKLGIGSATQLMALIVRTSKSD